MSSVDFLVKLRDAAQMMADEKAAVSMKSSQNVRCSDCRFWTGSCRKNRMNKTASDEACQEFEPRGRGVSHG